MFATVPPKKKHIQVVVVDENGVERVVSTEDEPLKVEQFGAEARGIIRNEALALGAAAAAEMKVIDYHPPQIIDKPMRNPKGGFYRPKEHTIWMNMVLHHNATNYRATLIHEMAHAVTQELERTYRERGQRFFRPAIWKSHGLMWSTVMGKMGAEPKVFHTMDVVAAMPEKYVAYQCPCGQRIQHGKRAVANAIAKGAQWSCRRCNRPIDMTKWSTAAAAEEPMVAAAGGKRRHSRDSIIVLARGVRGMMR
jgi:predicted SprT family Zn-dependent metalloprotease